ncbi:hypothetical protein [Denitromonas halophila]|uniref:Uncharacterized protein n=1 Tax=Denitromonas halophila TaxID=1629404 RepID=A0A557QLN8_9RHOO|nr:hypothetical protein [Denitromonas halophila]TVO53822.1 hypothetical protein FHP91_13575 [Denitromonas halophila]
MITATPPPELQHATLTATAHGGLTATTRDGKPAALAVIDSDGNIIETGPQIGLAIWLLTAKAYGNFMAGKGYIKEHAGPIDKARAA